MLCKNGKEILPPYFASSEAISLVIVFVLKRRGAFGVYVLLY
jgi:hypothetical protein